MSVTREMLYEAIWEVPMITVAQAIGVSARTLGDVCRQHSVPTPPRGHWRRVRTNQPVRRAVLLPVDGAQTLIRLPAESEKVLVQLLRSNVDPPAAEKGAAGFQNTSDADSAQAVRPAQERDTLDSSGKQNGNSSPSATVKKRVGPVSKSRATRITPMAQKSIPQAVLATPSPSSHPTLPAEPGHVRDAKSQASRGPVDTENRCPMRLSELEWLTVCARRASQVKELVHFFAILEAELPALDSATAAVLSSRIEQGRRDISSQDPVALVISQCRDVALGRRDASW